MSRAALSRLAIGLTGGALALTAWVTINNPALGFVVCVMVFGFTSMVAERIFRQNAAPDEVRADLEERVRNPPS